ncbi:MAG: 3-deoxy-D-manno-octulosonic acid transferase, partial [Candidatus Omnitrophota bacterium]
AGSTHSPEEAAIIDIYEKLKAGRSGLRLVLAPRHIDRIGAISSFIEKYGAGYRRFSDIISGKKIAPAGKDIILVDTIGHLKNIYNVATLIFVGGSLARRGGQNPIEGAKWGKAIVFGPHMSNFREVASIFTEGGGAVRVKDKGELKSALEDLLENPDKRKRMSDNARKIIEENSGATVKTLERIGEYLK